MTGGSLLGEVGVTLFFNQIDRQPRELLLPSVEMWFVGRDKADRRKEYGRERKRQERGEGK